MDEILHIAEIIFIKSKHPSNLKLCLLLHVVPDPSRVVLVHLFKVAESPFPDELLNPRERPGNVRGETVPGAWTRGEKKKKKGKKKNMLDFFIMCIIFLHIVGFLYLRRGPCCRTCGTARNCRCRPSPPSLPRDLNRHRHGAKNIFIKIERERRDTLERVII